MKLLRYAVYALPAILLTIIYSPFWLLSLIGNYGQYGCTKAVVWLQDKILK